MIFEQILSKLRLYNVNTNINDEFNIKNLIEDMKLEIVTYCNLEDYPEDNKQLNSILVNLVVFYFLKSKNTTFLNGENTQNNNVDNNIKSINVGDFSVSYGTDNSAITNEFAMSEINKCYLMLNKFRRLIW